MPDYDNTNKLSLWLNRERKTQSHPHLKGQGETSEGVWVSAWFSKDIDPDDAKRLMGIIKRHDASSKAPFLKISLTVK